MKKSLFALLALGLVIVLSVGCATVMTGDKQVLSVNSTPDNATVKIMTTGGMDIASGKTPMEFRLSRKYDYIVKVELEGYQDKQITVTKGFNTWVLGNVICGGIPGLIIDLVSGAINQLDPGEVYITLEKVDSTDNGEEYQIAVYTKDENGDVVRYYDTLVPELPVDMTE